MLFVTVSIVLLKCVFETIHALERFGEVAA